MSFAAMMEQLKKEYIASLPEKMNQIELHIEQKSYDAILEDFHKLKGTGSTYGLSEISTLAQAVEDICMKDAAQGLETATKALAILRDIYESRVSDTHYPLETDLRFTEISARIS